MEITLHDNSKLEFSWVLLKGSVLLDSADLRRFLEGLASGQPAPYSPLA
jgi:hypothetical protein